jgi:hypothetical protein
MGWLDDLESAAGSVAKGVVHGAEDLAQGGEKALGDAWNGALSAATSASGALDAGKDISAGLGKGAADLIAGAQRGDVVGGLEAAAVDVMHGEAAGIRDLWNGAANGTSHLFAGINQGVHSLGAAAQHGYEDGVDGVATGIGKIAGAGAEEAFRSTAMAAEEPIKQLAQFDWGVTEGVSEGLGGAVKGIGGLVGGAYRFATDSHFRDGVIGMVENGATYVAEHPLDAAALAGSAIKNAAVDVYHGGVEAAKNGDLTEYIGKAIGQVGLAVATTALAPEAEIGEGAGLAADGAGMLGNLSKGAEVLSDVSTDTKIAEAGADAGSLVTRASELSPIARSEATATDALARGEPYAFGTGARSDRAQAIVDNAAQVLGHQNASGLVDHVLYDEAESSPFFTVDATTGERTITLDPGTFEKTEAGQLIAGTHELVHAEQWQQALSQNAGNLAAAHNAMFRGSQLDYAIREVLTERRALQTVNSFLGGMTPQQIGHSTRYIEFWQNAVVRLGGTRVP